MGRHFSFEENQGAQIVVFHDNIDDVKFFDSAIRTRWFGYTVKLIQQKDEAFAFLEEVERTMMLPDLVLVANVSWQKGGEDFVEKIRTRRRLFALPVYCLAYCQKRIESDGSRCADLQWRHETNCDHDLRGAKAPFLKNTNPRHPAYLNGFICSHNIEVELPLIIDSMINNWFQQPFATSKG